MQDTTTTKQTPLMKQYNAIKAKYPGALLLFRMGDFYETFGEDAVKASKILDIVLTKRSNGAASKIELAGFPHHALDNYLPKLVRAGQRVAICDQLEDPKMAKGIVKRGVTELVTPGVSLNDNVLDVKQNNYLAAIYFGEKYSGISFLDISTGEFLTSQGDDTYIDKLLQSLKPAEVLYNKSQRKIFQQKYADKYHTWQLDEWVFQHDYGYEKLIDHFGTKSLKGFGIEKLEAGIISAGAILHYLSETEHHNIKHIASIARIEEERYVWLDKFSIRNLELLYSMVEGGVPLIDILDQTVTPMGARLMKKWIVLPLKEKAAIEERLKTVESFVKNKRLQEEVYLDLKQIGDIERLISKVAVNRVNPREMVHLKKALDHILPVKNILTKSKIPHLKKLAGRLNSCDFLRKKIGNELKEEAPLLTNQGNIFKDGVNKELDELRKLTYSGKETLVQIQERERKRTAIPSLKIAYTKVFGYYLEVSNTHKSKVPTDWIRKQTLVNAERYITEELKEYEEKILNAEEKFIEIEQRLFDELVVSAQDYVTQIQQVARTLAIIDCLLSFAKIAVKNNYIKPQIIEAPLNLSRVLGIDIKNGRHPVIEQQLPLGESYVPNDLYLDNDTQQILIITGPNMAGKSALLRQTALIVLMAQMGSFVPADSAKISIVDKVFTRVGASDNLSVGESTFMIEMIETASILNNLSDRSLILMDEIGRGTSTYDGISIAWSIVEFLHNHSKYRAKTLFATHYHELNQLTDDFSRIKNYSISVKEAGNKVIFLRKLVEGGSEHSFGIHVAQMAGIPTGIVLRANEIMHHLEKDKISEDTEGPSRQSRDEVTNPNLRKKTGEKLQGVPKENYQLRLFDAKDPRYDKIKELFGKLDVNAIAPIEALLKLNEIKLIIEDKNEHGA
ncbi:MAG: DNA mismatch repair protein MutS [Cytophagales bacterium]|nr:DNA mismatch repair protein MutS [Cytophagales bacterium]